MYLSTSVLLLWSGRVWVGSGQGGVNSSPTRPVAVPLRATSRSAPSGCWTCSQERASLLPLLLPPLGAGDSEPLIIWCRLGCKRLPDVSTLRAARPCRQSLLMQLVEANHA